jgi:hypothetical protein
LNHSTTSSLWPRQNRVRPNQSLSAKEGGGQRQKKASQTGRLSRHLIRRSRTSRLRSQLPNQELDRVARGGKHLQSGRAPAASPLLAQGAQIEIAAAASRFSLTPKQWPIQSHRLAIESSRSAGPRSTTWTMRLSRRLRTCRHAGGVLPKHIYQPSESALPEKRPWPTLKTRP